MEIPSRSSGGRPMPFLAGGRKTAAKDPLVPQFPVSAFRSYGYGTPDQRYRASHDSSLGLVVCSYEGLPFRCSTARPTHQCVSRVRSTDIAPRPCACPVKHLDEGETGFHVIFPKRTIKQQVTNLL